MAKKEHEGGKHKAKKHLTGIMTRKAKDGTFGHDHHYEDEDGNASTAFGGTSANLDDVKQHMDDHFGAGAEGEPEAAPEGGAGPQPQAGPEPAQ